MYIKPPIASLLVLLLFFCVVLPCSSNTDSETVVVFKSKKTEVLYKNIYGNKIKKHKPSAFRVPAFVGGVLNSKEFLVVICDARYDSFFGFSFTESTFRTSFGNHTQWSSAKSFANTTINKNKNAVIGRITAVMKGNKIYALATIFDKLKYLPTMANKSKTGWDTVMFVGSVEHSKDVNGGDNVTIIWGKETSLKSLLPESIFNVPAAYFTGGVGNGVVMKNGAIVFPVQISDTNKKTLASIIYSKDNGFTWRMGGTTPFYSSESSVTEFGNNKLLLSVRFDWKARAVFESDNLGATWKLSPIFMGIWGNNNQDRNYSDSQRNFVTASVDGKDILFFLHPLTENDENSYETLQLWMSDGTRIVYVGTISEKGNEASDKSALLAYFGRNLYIMREVKEFAQNKNTDDKFGKWNKFIALSSLQDLFESAKKKIREWRKLDKMFQSKGIPADGLVGFLKNRENTDITVWEDMYNCVNGTVKGGEFFHGGFRFNGKYKSNAEWPVISHKENQMNRFTLCEFTLTATVIIHSASAERNVSLLGVSEDERGNNVLIGIGYTEEKKWYTINGNNLKSFTNVSFELEKEYHIALTFADEMAFVFVNGLNITSGTRTNFFLSWVDHFFMSKVQKKLTATKSFCTVKNVMLFNRRLKQKEIAQLSSVSRNGNL